jgi:hypothetical protein
MSSPGGAAPRLAIALVAVGFLGVAGAARSFLDGPPVPPAPPRLSDTGLYDATGQVAAGNRPFSPQYPLWTDGAAKTRWIHLPEGSTIGVSDLDAWRFPVGTKLWKEFAWNGRKVETRFLWRATEDEWIFASYAWNEAGTEAFLVPEAGQRQVVEVAPGKGHSIPGVADCLACHTSQDTPVLGFNALQLSDDRDPLAPHAEPLPPGALTLRSLDGDGWLDPPRPDLVARPPRIREREPVARAALGYLSVNCGTCHNSTGALARLGFDLRHDADGDIGSPEPAHATAVDAPTRFPLPGVPDDSTRIIAPGSPRRSALLHRMASRRPSSQMPPLGTVLADTVALHLIRSWIESLDGGDVASRRTAS